VLFALVLTSVNFGDHLAQLVAGHGLAQALKEHLQLVCRHAAIAVSVKLQTERGRMKGEIITNRQKGDEMCGEEGFDLYSWVEWETWREREREGERVRERERLFFVLTVLNVSRKSLSSSSLNLISFQSTSAMSSIILQSVCV